MKRKHYLQVALLAIALAASLPCFSQTKVYGYTYDDSGNRKMRQYIQLKSATVPEGEGLAEKQQILEDALGGHEIKIYPNPTKGRVTVSINGLEKQAAKVYVFNTQGKLITENDFTGPENTVDLSGQPAGMYLMKIVVGENSTDWKIIKD